MSSFKEQDPGFAWPSTSKLLGQASSISKDSIRVDNVVSTTNSIISTTARSILTEGISGLSSETSINNITEFNTSTLTETANLEISSTDETMGNFGNEVVTPDFSNLKSTFDTIEDYLKTEASEKTMFTKASATTEPSIFVTNIDKFKEIFRGIFSSRKPFITSDKIEEPLNINKASEFDETLTRMLSDISTEKPVTSSLVSSDNPFVNTTQENVSFKTTFDAIGDLFEEATSPEKQVSIKTTRDIFSNIMSSPTPPFISEHTDNPLSIDGGTKFESIFTDISTERPFILSSKIDAEKTFFDSNIKINSTSTVNTISDWLSNNTGTKSILNSYSEEPMSIPGKDEHIFTTTLNNVLETTVTESINITEEPFQLFTNKSFEDIFDTAVVTKKPLLEQVFDNEKMIFQLNNKTELLEDIYTTFTSIEPVISDTTTKTLNITTNTPIQDISKTTNYRVNDREIVTELFSTISNNVSMQNTTKSDSIMDLDRDVVIYILLGVTLVVLMIAIVGIFVCFRKCRREHDVTGEYHVSQLKEYSDSSTKSPETISDTMINIKM